MEPFAHCLFDRASHWWKLSFWEDSIRILSVKTTGQSLIVNDGDGEVYVAHMLVTEGVGARIVDIRAPLAPGKFLSFGTEKTGWVMSLTKQEHEELLKMSLHSICRSLTSS